MEPVTAPSIWPIR